MEEFVRRLTFWQALTLLCIIGIFIIGILCILLFIITRLIKRGAKVNTKLGSLEIGEFNKNNNSEEETFNIHFNLNILESIVEKITSITTQKSKIIYIETLNKQMIFAEQRFEKLQGILQSKYLKLLKEKTGHKKNLTVNEDYKYYSTLLQINFRDIIENILLSSFKLNSIPSPDIRTNDKPVKNPDWEPYISIKYDTIMQRHTNYLNNMYIGLGDDKLISREEIHDFTYEKNTLNEIKEIIEEIYLKAYIISIESNEKIKDLSIELKEFLNNYIK